MIYLRKKKKKMKQKRKNKDPKHPDNIIRNYNNKLTQVYSKMLESEIESKILSNLDQFIINGVLNRTLLDKAILDLKNSMVLQTSNIKQAARQSFKKLSKYNMSVLKSQLKQIENEK